MANNIQQTIDRSRSLAPRYSGTVAPPNAIYNAGRLTGGYAALRDSAVTDVSEVLTRPSTLADGVSLLGAQGRPWETQLNVPPRLPNSQENTNMQLIYSSLAAPYILTAAEDEGRPGVGESLPLGLPGVGEISYVHVDRSRSTALLKSAPSVEKIANWMNLGGAASEKIQRATYAISAAMNKRVIRSLAQINFVWAVRELEDINRAAASPADREKFFNRVMEVDTPIHLLRSSNARNGVVFQLGGAGDVMPTHGADESGDMAMASVDGGSVDMFDYTMGRGNVNGARVVVVARRAPISVRDVFCWATTQEQMQTGHYARPLSAYGSLPANYANDFLANNASSRGNDVIFPMQLHVLCWPDGNVPPATYREYTSYNGQHHYDGVFDHMGLVLHHPKAAANGQRDYRPPPAPKELAPVTNMWEVVTRTKSKMTVLISPTKRN